MKFTGFLKEPIIDYITGKITILFEPCEDFREAYEYLKGCGRNTKQREALMPMLTIGFYLRNLQKLSDYPTKKRTICCFADTGK